MSLGPTRFLARFKVDSPVLREMSRVSLGAALISLREPTASFRPSNRLLVGSLKRTTLSCRSKDSLARNTNAKTSLKQTLHFLRGDKAFTSWMDLLRRSLQSKAAALISYSRICLSRRKTSSSIRSTKSECRHWNNRGCSNFQNCQPSKKTKRLSSISWLNAR